MKKTLFLFAALAALVAVPCRAQQTLTVYDGLETNNTVPAYIFWWDDFTRSQFVIPASDLAAMNGRPISAITFYSSNTRNITTDAEADVYLKEVSYTTMTGLEPKSSATVVYSGTFIVSDSTVTITFTEPYTYNGGNLLVGIENTTDAGYWNVYFYGQTVSGASWAGYDESSPDNVTGSQRDFIPKTTFTYDGGVSSTADWYGYVEYSQGNGFVPGHFCKFNMGPQIQGQSVSQDFGTYITSAEYLDGTVYLCSYDGTFYSASFTGSSPTMGTPVALGSVGEEGDVYTEMSYCSANQTMYAIKNKQALVSVNLSDGSHTVINGSLSDNNITTFAINAAGQAYGISPYHGSYSAAGNLYSINLSTGELTLVSTIGIGMDHSIMSMSFDRTTGELFCCFNGPGNGVWLINTATGHKDLEMYTGASMKGLFMVYDSGNIACNFATPMFMGTNPQTFTAGGPEGATYSWNFEGATPATATGATATATWSTPGSYTVTLTATLGNLTATYSKTIDVVEGTTVDDAVYTEIKQPINSSYNYGYSQQIYLQSELSSTRLIVSGLKFYVEGGPSVNPRGVKIYLGRTTAGSFTGGTDWKPISNQQLVYAGPYSFPLSDTLVSIVFDTPFLYNGTDNLLLTVVDTTGDYQSHPSYYYHRCITTSSTRHIYKYRDDSPIDPAAPPEGETDNHVNSVIFVTSPTDSVGIDAPTMGVFSLYPNPASGTVTLQLAEAATVAVIDLNGREVSRTTLGTGSHSIELSGLASGIYLVRAVMASGIRTEKLLVE